jgi:PTS system ascorbate-specific IIA component
MVGLLIIAHGSLAESLVACASHVLGKRLLPVRHIGVTIFDDPDALLPRAREAVASVDEGGGVLVLTDMLGATPANIATRLLVAGQVAGIAGVNLPMLVRVLTYAHLPLENVVAKALSGGRDGVVALSLAA